MTKRRRKTKDRAPKQAAQVPPAVDADIWTDRPDSGKCRPTPERLAKSDFRLHDAEDAGVTVAIDSLPTMLDRLCAKGIITHDQRDGGLDFAALIRRTRLTSEGRSCLDFSPVGTGGDPEPTHAELRDEQERAEHYLACGMFTFAEMRRVCVDQHEPRSLDRLRHGLDICVKFWGR